MARLTDPVRLDAGRFSLRGRIHGKDLRSVAKMLVQFGAFALVGALGTAVHYAVLLGAVQGLGWRPVAATSVGALCGAAINYFLNYHLTFRSRKAHAPTAAKFMLVAGVGLVLNAAIVAALTHGLNAHYMLAQVAATGGVLVWGFLANRLWTF